jgi:hypothetical protein
MSTIKLVRNDTGPQLRLTLTDSLQLVAAVDLTGATVTLHLRAIDTTTVLLSRNATILAPATNGIAVVVWQTADLDLDAGEYEGEVETVLASGLRETIFDPLQFTVREDFT